MPQETDISSLDEMLQLTIALQGEGYKKEDIEKILGRNFQRLQEKVSPPERKRKMRRY